MVSSVCTKSDALMASGQYLEAEALLRSALESHIDDSNLSERLGVLLCYTQREAEAVRFLKADSNSTRLGQILTDYYHCRSLMAAKLGVKDLEGRALQAEVSAKANMEPRDVGITLSACLIVKNEEKNLERCLKSLHGIVDEIVVVDTGSSDRTIEIAGTYGAKIGHFAWNDDFSAARNESLRLATGNWALWIDADEELAPNSSEMLREGLIRPHFGGYFIRIINFMREHGQSDQYVHTPVRLFQRLPSVHFVSRIHEQILPSLNELGLPTATIHGAQLNHYGYTPSAMEEKNKMHRTITMLEREIAEFPLDPFHWFNLANAYVTSGRNQDAVKAAATSVELMPMQAPYGSLTYHLLTSALIDVGRAKEALQRCIEADERGYGGILIEFERVRALTELQRFDEALESMEACLQLEWPDGLNGDYGIYTHKRQVLKGQILSLVEHNSEALDCFERALSVDPNCKLAQFGRGGILYRLGQYESALSSLEDCFADSELGSKAIRIAIQVHVQKGDAESAAVLCHQLWELGVHDEDLLFLWTQSCTTTGDWSNLSKAYERADLETGLSADSLINWSRSLLSLGNKEQARECIERAVERDPHNANARFNLGDILYSDSDYVPAAEAYQSGLQLFPTHAQGWFALGNCLYRLGSAAGARTCFEQALQAQPIYPEAATNLAILQEAA